MSTPPSKLSAFRSYNYHHILAICDSTETADALSRSTNEDVWHHPAANASELGRYSPKYVAGDDSMQYCILINGSVDASFVIQSAKWSAATAANATPGDKSTSVAVEGSLSILEPKGIVFLDQIVRCCKGLGIDSSQAIWVLKTVFVGFGFDPSVGEFVDRITDVSPIQFITTDIIGSFTEQGGIYDVQFVAMGGGAARLPQYSKLPLSMNISGAPTLGGTLKKLEATIAEMYKPYYDCVVAQLTSAVVAAGNDPTPIINALLPVKYEIRYDCAYELYTVSDQAQSAKNSADCRSPATIATRSNSSIEDIIHRIMSTSPEVKKDMTEGVNDIKYEYKIHAVMSSSRNSGPTVTYTVERFMRPKELMKVGGFEAFSDFEKGTANDPIMDPQLRKNIIRFDYIYTGKNIDILEFEMKMNTGNAYLQIASMTNTFKGQLDGAPNKTTTVATDDQTLLTRGGAMAPIPVFFGSQISSTAFKNSMNNINSAQAAWTMAKHASLEISEATMKIVGNLNFLGSIGNYTSPKFHEDRPVGNCEKTDQQKNSPDTNWGIGPSFALIKIKMPRNNDDIELFSGKGSGTSKDYAVDFWFDGYYYIYGFENDFSDGAFTQTLQLLGIPQKGIIQTLDNKDAREKESDLTKKITSCFDSAVGCGQPETAGSGSVPPVAAPVVDKGTAKPHGPEPTTKSDSDVVNKGTKTPADVKGWANAKPAIRDSITNAAAATGTNPTTLAQMAALESRFGANTHNPKSSATGTFQIVSKTWTDVVNRGGVPGVPPGTPFSEASDPAKNAAVAAVLMRDNQKAIVRAGGAPNINSVSAGDTYMAHFAGVGGASAVIKADLATSGSMTVKEAYKKYLSNGESSFNKQAAANPTILNDSTTVGEFRARAAAAMANSSGFGSSKVSGTDAAKSIRVNESITEPNIRGRTARVGLSRANDCKVVENKSPTAQTCDEARPDEGRSRLEIAPTPTPSAPPSGP